MMRNFINKHFEFSKVKAWIGMIFAALILGFGFMHTAGIHYAFFFATLFLLTGALRIKVKDNKNAFWVDLLWGLIAAVGLMFFTQYTMNFGSIILLGVRNILLELVIISFTFCLFFLLFQRISLSAACTALLLEAGAIANFYVFTFRGNELLPTDLMTVGTAANVAGNMSWTYPGHVHYAIVGTILLVFMSFCLPKRNKPEVKKRFTWLTHRLFTLAIMACLFTVWWYGVDSVNLRLFGRSATKRNGFLVSFTTVAKSMVKDLKPDDYSVDVVKDLEKKYGKVTMTDREKPDIIVIMDEAFSDFEHIGKLETAEEVIPFFNSLKENTTRGYAFTSVFGGGTCTTEFEFLTGHTNAFLPTGITAYQNYVTKPTYSCVAELKNLGYYTFATHAFRGNGYMRYRAYPNLGFDSMSFIEDYPNKQFIRKYISDQEMFEFITDCWEKRDKSKPYFTFGVTMQNHSMFDYSGPRYTPNLPLTGKDFKGRFASAQQYLGLIHESDKALKYLINYYKKVDHPVIVCMFGDHLPRMSDAFYSLLVGHTLDENDINDMAIKYQVPFIIWSNYKNKSKDVGLISISQMMNYVYEAAGIQSPYRNFLNDLHNYIPSYSVQGYYSKTEGKFIAIDEATGEEKKWFEKYKILQYNALFDKDHKSEIFFPLPEVN